MAVWREGIGHVGRMVHNYSSSFIPSKVRSREREREREREAPLTLPHQYSFFLFFFLFNFVYIFVAFFWISWVVEIASSCYVSCVYQRPTASAFIHTYIHRGIGRFYHQSSSWWAVESRQCWWSNRMNFNASCLPSFINPSNSLFFYSISPPLLLPYPLPHSIWFSSNSTHSWRRRY